MDPVEAMSVGAELLARGFVAFLRRQKIRVRISA